MISNPHAIPTKDSVPIVNLCERFENHYLIDYEESYEAEHGNCSRVDEPSLQIIPCKHGHIFPWAGDLIAASTNKSGKIANKLRSMDCCKIEQDGDDGVTVSFHVDDLEPVAEVIRPRRRRSLSPERRQALAEVGKAHRFSKSTGQSTVLRGTDASNDPKATSHPSKQPGGESVSQNRR